VSGVSGCSGRSASEAEPFRIGWEYQHPEVTPSPAERRGRGCAQVEEAFVGFGGACAMIRPFGELTARKWLDAGFQERAEAVTQARSAAHGRVGGVAGTATVVTVVVDTVVTSKGCGAPPPPRHTQRQAEAEKPLAGAWPWRDTGVGSGGSATRPAQSAAGSWMTNPNLLGFLWSIIVNLMFSI
jgi:hypothetical protein